MNDKFLSASYKGKDLLEATGIHSKASLQLKTLMEELSKKDFIGDFDSLVNKIFEFAFFIYGDKERADFFTEHILNELK